MISESRVLENGLPGLMSGDWKRGTVSGPQRLQCDAWTAPDLSTTAPALDSTPNSPLDPSLRDYWHKRARWRAELKYDAHTVRRILAARQNWRCPVCQANLLNEEPLDLHHKQAVARGGTDELRNLELRHEACHYNAHELARDYSVRTA